MSFVATVSRAIQANAVEAFTKFSDFELWSKFMPASFRPIRGPKRQLVAGDMLRMRLDTGAVKLPVSVQVFRVEAPHTISWGGGSRLLHADHRFVFEAQGDDGVMIRSEEEWSGLLTSVGPLAKRIRRQAEIVAHEQLDGFARFIERA